MTSEEAVLEELRLLRGIAGAQLVLALDRQEMTQLEKIEVLAKVGMTSRDIAQLLNTSPNTASVAMSKLRRSKRIK